MTDEKLADRLALAVLNDPKGERINTYVLFGLHYAAWLKGRADRVVKVARDTCPEARITSHRRHGHWLRHPVGPVRRVHPWTAPLDALTDQRCGPGRGGTHGASPTSSQPCF